ncbi:ABC transporter ATP-binding protein [Clostridioides sp. ES-S-0108-01]|uniref:ABC transporter ATP-binding protein n=1 Tax=Clostridioides sp. ES-S-0108-01 TaxID=2770773 RepID=UPI001D0BFA7E|nr:ABC transporter ATP-binding protein [Clostridioides sp. ES-S-0108-01]UDN51718.1 ABC transporter ATP-binding protein [Clostridioides sp. ES-S-0107-01]
MKYLLEIAKKEKLLVIIYLALGISIELLNSFSANYYQNLIDRFNNGTINFCIIFIYGAVLITLSLLRYIDEYPGRKLEHSFFLDLKLKALEKMSKIDYLEYQKLGTGKLIQKIENGANAGRNIFFNFLLAVVRKIIPSILFSMVFIYRIDKKVMFTILIGYFIVFIITNLLIKALYQIKEHILINEEKMNHFLVRGFVEMVVFRINKRFECEICQSKFAKKEIIDSKVKMTLIHEAFFTIFSLIVTFIKILIIVYSWKTKTISIGSIIALITLLDNAYTPIAIFNVLYIQFKLDKAAYKRYTDILELNNDSQLLSGKIVDLKHGNIDFNNIGFLYNNKRKIFNELTLSIKSGEKVAIVGESGSGKSTLIKLLIGLLKPSEGTIFIDDYNLLEMNLNNYYKYITYISQDSPIFDGTLRENIVFGKSIKSNDIIDVLEKVGLKKLYLKLEYGLDTKLGEKGTTLSGGEKQRLALARIWFSDAKIIILDEATSALDNITEEQVMLNVMEFLKYKTTIMVAHRLNSIKSFENIIVLKEGSIIGSGSFKELLDDNSYFRELYYTIS